MRIVDVPLILGLLLGATLPGSHLHSIPMSGMKEQGGAIAKTRSGQELWTNRWTMERTMLDGRPVLYFTESGQGKRSPFKQQVRWTTQSWWTNDGVILPLRSETNYVDATGRELLRETRNFDWPGKRVRFERYDSRTAKTTRETLNVPEDTLAVDGIAGILRGLDFTRAEPFSAHLLTNEPRIYRVTFEIRGKEKIQTEDGLFECYKVELVPHLGVLGVFRFLYPKSYFWFRVDSPHTWVRYEGLENGPGTPTIIMEMNNH
jgi:hypothetical protein